MEESIRILRLLLVDDHPLFRAGVAAVLSKQTGMKVVAEAGDGNEAIRLYREHRPDVALIDLRMP